MLLRASLCLFIFVLSVRIFQERELSLNWALNQHLFWMYNSSLYAFFLHVLIRIYEFRNEFHVVRLAIQMNINTIFDEL